MKRLLELKAVKQQTLISQAVQSVQSQPLIKPEQS
jgi:hypothetical protein